MRETKGKLIAVFNPGKHGSGSTTFALGLGIALEYITHKKVLIVNNADNLSLMEKFIENNINVEYSIDNLQIFNSSISEKTIETYATMINDNLFMLAGTSMDNEIRKTDMQFEENFINECRKIYDIVVMDLPARISDKNANAFYLDKADLIIAAVKYNEIDLDDIFVKPIYLSSSEILMNEKTYVSLNFMDKDSDIPKEVERLKKKYGFKSAYGFAYDGNIINVCCKQRKMYSYIQDELYKENHVFPQQLKEFSEEVIRKLELECEFVEKPKPGLLKSLFRK